MRATILIVVMILLQTGAFSLGLMVDRRLIPRRRGCPANGSTPESGLTLVLSELSLCV